MDVLFPFFVTRGKEARAGEPKLRLEPLLDERGRHFLTVYIDHVGGPASERETAILVTNGEISGIEEAVPEKFGGCFGISEVVGRPACSGNSQPAQLARRKGTILSIHDLNDAARNRLVPSLVFRTFKAGEAEDAGLSRT
jgi:hypothetical protein